MFFTFFLSCTSTESEKHPHSSSFFDLKLFFNNEMKEIQQIDTVDKTIEINETTETKILSNSDLAKEISTFSDYDINRPAWIDKYRVDSVFNDKGNLKFLEYRAIDENMRTQILEICYSNEKVTNVFIRNIINGFATKSKKEITYAPRYGYSILTEQKTLLGSKQEIKVDVKYKY